MKRTVVLCVALVFLALDGSLGAVATARALEPSEGDVSGEVRDLGAEDERKVSVWDPLFGPMADSNAGKTPPQYRMWLQICVHSFEILAFLPMIVHSGFGKGKMHNKVLFWFMFVGVTIGSAYFLRMPFAVPKKQAVRWSGRFGILGILLAIGWMALGMYRTHISKKQSAREFYRVGFMGWMYMVFCALLAMLFSLAADYAVTNGHDLTEHFVIAITSNVAFLLNCMYLLHIVYQVISKWVHEGARALAYDADLMFSFLFGSAAVLETGSSFWSNIRAAFANGGVCQYSHLLNQTANNATVYCPFFAYEDHVPDGITCQVRCPEEQTINGVVVTKDRDVVVMCYHLGFVGAVWTNFNKDPCSIQFDSANGVAARPVHRVDYPVIIGQDPDE